MRRITVSEVTKSFVLHHQGGVQLPVLQGVSFHVDAGELVVLSGPSGSGKSSLLKILYGNYLADAGSVRVVSELGETDLVRAHPHEVLALRRHTLGFVSQFLRVIPRVSTWDLVAEPLQQRQIDAREIQDRVAHMLTRLNLPERLWSLAPATFSGGEQQRVNIARSLIAEFPIVLLDEPTASLDIRNRDVVCELIVEARDRGAALVGIFHDAEVRAQLADRLVEIEVEPCR